MNERGQTRLGEIFWVFLRLGTTSFGGPVAHLGYFRSAFVKRLGWLDDEAFGEIVAFCNVLPGPTSSQVGIVVGHLRGGFAGALAAWTAFTAPSAFALVLFASGVPLDPHAGWVHGLIVAAAGVVGAAVYAMAQTLAPDALRRGLAVASAALALGIAGEAGQLCALALGATIGLIFLRSETAAVRARLDLGLSRRFALGCALALGVSFLGIPLVAQALHAPLFTAAGAFFDTGALVFGGGHVVLPLLQSQVVSTGWVTPERFIAGYGAAQAIPGPLFTFAAYLGTLMQVPPATAPAGALGALVATVAIFLPSFLMVYALAPWWSVCARNPRWAAALRGLNAAVVGLLLAALYRPVLANAIRPLGSGAGFWFDLALALAAFAALAFSRTPAWLVVGSAALLGAFGA